MKYFEPQVHSYIVVPSRPARKITSNIEKQ